MGNHEARFPGKINDPDTMVLSEKQAGRLAAISKLPVADLKNKTLGDLRKANLPRIDPSWFLHRTICGRVVKTDAAGADHPVPFATVKVYDTDIGLLGWSPVHLPYTWFLPLYFRRELLATVTTDECGRFCVSIPRWELDFYLRWRVERQCYLTWLRWPNVQDILAVNTVIPGPQPDPGPLHIDEHVLAHASRVLDAPLVDRLRAVAPSMIGDEIVKVSDVMAAPAFQPGVRPPFTAAAKAQLATKDVAQFASRLSVKPELLKNLSTEKFVGPFLRCRTVIVPEWMAVLDVPDVTFEALQDVNGDGTQEVIYSEGLFDVRWNATSIPNVTLHANSIAVTGLQCDGPPSDVSTGAPAILFAGNYPLKQAGLASSYQDDLGFSILCNRPDADGIPSTPNRTSPANAPFYGSFFLVGNAERPGATHYRIAYQSAGGTTYLNQGFGPLLKLVGNVLHQLIVSPVNGQWYPIVPRADGWTPVGLLAPFGATGDTIHSFRLELGVSGAGGITPLAGSLTQPVHVHVDMTAPSVSPTLEWRHPNLSSTFTSLPLAACPIVTRTAGQRVQFRFTVTVSANHLRDYTVIVRGCGAGPAPQLITDGRDGLPVQPATAESYWHRSASDNSSTVVLHYELAAGAPAGCYQFIVAARSRTFDPRTTVALAPGQAPENFWNLAEQAPIYVIPFWSVAVQ